MGRSGEYWFRISVLLGPEMAKHENRIGEVMADIDPNWLRTFGLTLSAVFFAELGDKTQLATFAFASKTKHISAVLSGSILALALSSIIATFLGLWLSKYVDPKWVHYGAATLFLVIGVFMVWQGPPSS